MNANRRTTIDTQKGRRMITITADEICPRKAGRIYAVGNASRMVINVETPASTRL